MFCDRGRPTPLSKVARTNARHRRQQASGQRQVFCQHNHRSSIGKTRANAPTVPGPWASETTSTKAESAGIRKRTTQVSAEAPASKVSGTILSPLPIALRQASLHLLAGPAPQEDEVTIPGCRTRSFCAFGNGEVALGEVRRILDHAQRLHMNAHNCGPDAAGLAKRPRGEPWRMRCQSSVPCTRRASDVARYWRLGSTVDHGG